MKTSQIILFCLLFSLLTACSKERVFPIEPEAASQESILSDNTSKARIGLPCQPLGGFEVVATTPQRTAEFAWYPGSLNNIYWFRLQIAGTHAWKMLKCTKATITLMDLQPNTLYACQVGITCGRHGVVYGETLQFSIPISTTEYEKEVIID